MKQKEIYAYDADGKYAGLYVATDEQFLKTGLTKGVKPPFVPPTPAEIEAAKAALTDIITTNDERMKVIMLVIFDMYDRLSVALPSEFPALTNQQKWNFVKSKIE